MTFYFSHCLLTFENGLIYALCNRIKFKKKIENWETLLIVNLTLVSND